MIKLVKVTIANSLDDTLRSEIMAYDSNEVDVDNYWTDIALLNVDLSDYSMEEVIDMRIIKPRNISNVEKHKEIVRRVFNP